MTRIVLRPFLVVGLALAILVYVGCGKTVETTPPKLIESSKGPITEAPVVKVSSSDKLFADWKNPVGALLITGEQEGYLEPCGCTEGQLGGIARRLDLINKIEAQGIPLARIDLGSLIKNPAASRGGMEHAKHKFGIALRAVETMKYDAVGLSAQDLRLGVAEVLSVYLNIKDKPKIVAANAVPDEAFKDVIKTKVIATAGKVTIGVTCVLDPAAYKEIQDADKSLLAIKPPQEVLPAILAELEKESQVQVLMVQGPVAMAEELAKANPGFDIVVPASRDEEPDESRKFFNDGKTRVVSVGKKGKYVGVIGFLGGGEPASNMAYAKLSLMQSRYREADVFVKLINEELQAQFKAAGVVANYPRRGNADAIPGSLYVGADQCKSCHPNTYAKWATTGHGKAYEGLTKPGRNREFDAECVTCHTTGFTYVSGWVSAEKTPYLKGNQCENCHGPASKHIEEPDNKAFIAKMHRTAEQADKQSLCLQCHDLDNSPKFKFENYYGKISHKGMDKYDDPATHKGIPVPAAVTAQPK